MIENHKVSHSDEYFMELAIEQAVIAQARGEVPVGALFVEDEEILVASANASIELSDPTAHAEVMVMRKAAQLKGNYRLGGSIYVTLEPCLMCLGAMIHARVDRLIFVVHEKKIRFCETQCRSRLINCSFYFSEFPHNSLNQL